jgi:hypothetical protein
MAEAGETADAQWEVTTREEASRAQAEAEDEAGVAAANQGKRSSRRKYLKWRYVTTAIRETMVNFFLKSKIFTGFLHCVHILINSS